MTTHSKKLNILVTGGAGYIGSVTSAQLIDQGHTVVVFDNLSHGHNGAISPEAIFIQGDLANHELLKKTLVEHKIDAVVHFAAFIEAGESMKYPEVFFDNNTINTLHLLRIMHELSIQNFVFSSTAAVYGEPEKVPITEHAKLKPTNAYGESKLLVEYALSWYNQIHGLSYAALRYFNACGATQNLGEDHQPESHLIPRALASAMGNGESLKLFGTDYETKDGTCIRDYIHVSDLAHAHLLSLNKLVETPSSKLIYNLGSQHGFSNLEVITAVEKIVGKPVPYEKAPRRSGDPAVLVASSEKIRTELGWQPKYSNIEEIIKTAFEWRKRNPHGYGK